MPEEPVLNTGVKDPHHEPPDNQVVRCPFFGPYAEPLWQHVGNGQPGSSEGRNVHRLKQLLEEKSHPDIACLLLLQYQCCSRQLAARQRVSEQCGYLLLECTVIKPLCFVDISFCIRGLGNPSRKKHSTKKPLTLQDTKTNYLCTNLQYIHGEMTQRILSSPFFPCMLPPYVLLNPLGLVTGAT